MILELTPHRLNASLEKVRLAHPVKLQPSDTIHGSLVDEVRKELQAAGFKDLFEIAYKFNTAKIMACLEILVHDRDEKTALKAAEILKYRPREQVIIRGWFKLVQYYPKDLLERLLKEIIDKKGFGVLENCKGISPKITTWFVSYNIPEGILRDYQNFSNTNNFDIYLRDNFFKEKDGIYKACWRTFLKKGNVQNIKKERAERILLEYIRAENAPHLCEFGQHYLNALMTRDNWKEKILSFIENKYGPPRSLENNIFEKAFWEKVKISAKREFNSWLLEKNIDKFFEGERADFWRRFVPVNKIIRVKEILNGKGFLMDFKKFGVVEFKSLGNAAYVYPKQNFEIYWANSESQRYKEWFKDREKTISHKSFPDWDGRIIHSGDWQSGTFYKITKLLEIL